MSNLGLIFLKRHLSCYGLYRLFLVVNFSLPQGYGVLLKQINIDEIVDERLSHGYRPKKHCRRCAEIQYHSFVFDLPWIHDCPIHKAPLLRRCNKCNQKWPSVSEIRRRKCSVCGVDVRFKELIKLGALSAKYLREFAWHTFDEIRGFASNDKGDAFDCISMQTKQDLLDK